MGDGNKAKSWRAQSCLLPEDTQGTDIQGRGTETAGQFRAADNVPAESTADSIQQERERERERVCVFVCLYVVGVKHKYHTDVLPALPHKAAT